MYCEPLSGTSSQSEREYRSPHSPVPSIPSPHSEPEETFEEQEARVGKEIMLLTNISSSSLDEAFMPPLSSLADDFRQFQDLMKQVADSLYTLLKEVQDSHHSLLDILHTSSSTHVVLPINESFLEPVKSMWHISARASLHARGLILKNNLCLGQGFRVFIFSFSIKLSGRELSQ